MNKTQIKILIKKILPISILLIVIVGALFIIPIIRYLGAGLEKENEEWYSNPDNKRKIESIIKNDSKENLKNKIVFQNENIVYVKSLKINIEGWKVTSRHIEKNDEIGLLQLIKDVDYFNIFFMNSNNYSDLKEYAEYQNQKIVDNLGKQGILLEPIEKMERIIKERYAYIEIYRSQFKGDEQPSMVIMNVQHSGYYYSISYPIGKDNVSKLFDNFIFVD